MFLAHRAALNVSPVAALQISDALLHHVLGSTRAGGDQDCLIARKPLLVDLARAVDQICGTAGRLSAFLVEDGDPVEPGQVVATLDDE